MFLSLLILFSQITWANSISDAEQTQIDYAYELIMGTQVGRNICHDVLGSDAEAIATHLGTSEVAAQRIAKRCPVTARTSTWIYPTKEQDIRKLVGRSQARRQYQFIQTEEHFPIESWTSPKENLTTIVASEPLSDSRLVQILAHEMAVYFDAKATLTLPDVEVIPSLKVFKESLGQEYPVVAMALSDPLTAHTLTYLRALRVEFAILRELVDQRKIETPSDWSDPYLHTLASDSCNHACIQNLVIMMREAYLPIALPLIAFAPQYGALASRVLPRMNLDWKPSQWVKVKDVFERYPLEFKNDANAGDVVTDLKRVFAERPTFASRATSDFMGNEMWQMESGPLLSTRLASGESLLEFMKRPLLSGYNIFLSSGPRVRIRGGGVE